MNKFLCSVLSIAVTMSLVDADCPVLPSLPNASFNKDDQCSDISIQCNKGFTMKQILHCVDEEWEYQGPICEPSVNVKISCLNEGTLLPTGTCKCTDEYTGVNCEKKLCDKVMFYSCQAASCPLRSDGASLEQKKYFCDGGKFCCMGVI